MRIVTYMHEIAIFFIIFNFCYECARDLISLPVDQKYEMKENDKNYENRPIFTIVVP